MIVRYAHQFGVMRRLTSSSSSDDWEVHDALSSSLSQSLEVRGGGRRVREDDEEAAIDDRHLGRNSQRGRLELA